MVKKTILFDIDYTLLDTDVIRNNRTNSIAKYVRKSPADVKNESQRYIDTLVTTKDFSPKELAKHLSNVWGHNEDVLYKQIWNKSVAGKSLYPGTEDTLKILKDNFRLGTYSEGFENIQKFKLKANSIKKYFEPELMYIARRKMINIPIVNLGEVIIVDDNKEVIKFLKKFENVTPIWLNRKSKRRMASVITIFDIKELINVVN